MVAARPCGIAGLMDCGIDGCGSIQQDIVLTDRKFVHPTHSSELS